MSSAADRLWNGREDLQTPEQSPDYPSSPPILTADHNGPEFLVLTPAALPLPVIDPVTGHSSASLISLSYQFLPGHLPFISPASAVRK